jgi:hypothetical protein
MSRNHTRIVICCISIVLSQIFLYLASSLMVNSASAEPLRSPDDLDTIATQTELERLTKADPATAAHAGAALKADQAEKATARRERRSRRPNASKRIVNGLGTIRYPAAGAVLKGSNRRSASAWCSGTLIGCSTFLTAAHCIMEDPNPGNYKVFFQHAGIFDVAEVHWQKDKFKFPDADIAILKLSRPVEGITPIPINRAAKPINGSKGRIVGYGRTGGESSDYGIKRMGFVKTAACEPPRSDTTLICWKYDAVVKTPGEDSNTCNGDSGGGLQIEGDNTVAGVTSGGLRKDCLGGDRSYDANIFQYQEWIDSVAGSDRPINACGTVPQIDVQRHVEGGVARLDEAKTQVVYDLEVPAGISRLYVAMNGEDSGRNNFDLYLMRDRTTEVSTPVCIEDGPGQFGFCDVKEPTPGDWTIVVRRARGAGLVQTVVTMIPTMP